MAGKRNSAIRQALILAFAAGALTGSAGALTLRRRRQEGGFPAGDAAGHLTEPSGPPLGERFDGPSLGSTSMPAAQHG
ncbi:hypothetical protein [Micromonospora sp. KC213]|uniref:hypothetical protein n=1 Tax=Micromonospora sp. KC213 TaxID=2530378 RepID=UPI00104D3D3F|nr:hypothetical protein [Micromonospora sp. KC213]TDC38402.1 hypothetical protein E1166_18510 [Micromonospora sp. KC213]